MTAIENNPRSQRESWLIVATCLLLAALVWIVFGQTRQHEFVNYDDPEYVQLQPEITAGLTLRGVAWAFTHAHSGNWHPLTSITHMLDRQFHGANAAGHHLTNVALHAAAAIVLFLALRQMTRRIGGSAFVAALFAIHPLRVESVAWVAERKDVLSGLFFMLTLAAYARYARQPSWTRYLLMAGAMALGLISKPMLVTLPCVLLLLDYWPLKREARLGRLILEKLPLLLLSAGACAATLLVQSATMSSLERLPLPWRAVNAFVSIVTYAWQVFWPVNLAVFYPHPRGGLPLWTAGLAIAGVLGISGLAIALRRRYRYLPVGWFWFLGMLVPVLGFVQVGLQSHADRYTYLPHIGLYLAGTWLIVNLTQHWRFQRQILGVGAAIALGALSWCAARQTVHWRTSESLWQHALAVTKGNGIAHTNLGNLLPAGGAIPHYEKALEIDPDFMVPLNNLAWILATSPEAAMRDGAKAVRLAEQASRLSAQNDPVILRTLATAYAESRRFSEAITTAQRALALAQREGNAALAFDLRNNLAGYQFKQPVRDASLLEAAPE